MNGRWRGLSSSSWYFCDVYMMTKPLRAKMSLLCRMAHIQTKCVIFSKKYIKFQDNNFIIKALYGLEKSYYVSAVDFADLYACIKPAKTIRLNYAINYGTMLVLQNIYIIMNLDIELFRMIIGSHKEIKFSSISRHFGITLCFLLSYILLF